jgi:L-ascorbate metabolism protein UlaG (beta-lactamase superfamily)
VLPQVTFLGHASVLVEFAGVRIVTDPILFGHVSFLNRVSEPLVPSAYRDVDVVVISHLHHDHCDLRSLRLLNAPTVIVPIGGAKYLRKKGISNVFELAIGRSHAVGDAVITAVPAVHDGFRLPFGPRAQAIGYLVQGDAQTIYFAGDTDVFPEMKLIPEIAVEVDPQSRGIDLALLPVWGWGPNLGPGHMDPSRAVEAMNYLQPQYAIPIHWGTLFPFGLRVIKPSLGQRLSDPPREFARIAEQRKSPTHVEVVEPGAQAVLAG